MQSRLSRNVEKKTKKQLYLSILGIVILVVLLFKFGIPALVNVSLFLSSLNNKNTAQVSNQSQSVVQPPTLTSSFTATNSATITVSGSASPKQTVELFVNDSQVDSITTKDDGSFSFSNVSLTQQQNTIKAKAQQGTTTSDFSDPLSIMYIQKAPNLTLDSPTDQQSFSGDKNSVIVRGKTDSDVKVTVNDFWAIVDANGNYSYNLHLQDGDNHITVVATDPAGNTTKREITVKYSH